jgi:hypothetical protein
MKQTAVEWYTEQEIKLTLDFLANKINQLDYGIKRVKLIEQAKAMEKEQMCSFAEFVATYPDKNKNINGEMLHAKSKYDGAERTVDLLETFKSE